MNTVVFEENTPALDYGSIWYHKPSNNYYIMAGYGSKYQLVNLRSGVTGPLTTLKGAIPRGTKLVAPAASITITV